MIENGQLTSIEKPLVVEALRAQSATAAAADKPKVVERLDKLVNEVLSIIPINLPVNNLAELYALNENLQKCLHLEKQPWKNLSGSERDQVLKKKQIQDDIKAVEKAGTMWFE